MLGFWDNTDALSKLAKSAPYVFIVLGFLLAFFGQYVKTLLDNRIEVIKAKKEAERKNTAPLVDAQLARSQDGRVVVVIASGNEVPFKANWLIVTEQDHIVTGVMMVRGLGSV